MIDKICENCFFGDADAFTSPCINCTTKADKWISSQRIIEVESAENTIKTLADKQYLTARQEIELEKAKEVIFDAIKKEFKVVYQYII